MAEEGLHLRQGNNLLNSLSKVSDTQRIGTGKAPETSEAARIYLSLDLHVIIESAQSSLVLFGNSSCILP